MVFGYALLRGLSVSDRSSLRDAELPLGFLLSLLSLSLTIESSVEERLEALFRIIAKPSDGE